MGFKRPRVQVPLPRQKRISMQERFERRKTPRTKGKFIVSFKRKDADFSAVDVSQTKDIGGGGMLLSSNKSYEKGAVLSLKVRLPFKEEPVSFNAKVLGSSEIVKELHYDTRLEFIDMDENQKKCLTDTLNHYLKRKENER